MPAKKSTYAMLLVLICGQAVAQDENGPIILSERLQELALEYPVAERLGIDWAEPSENAVGRYISFLAATDVVAREIASRAGRESPTDSDYQTALFLQCIWPPNKPVVVEEYWPLEEPAFYSAAVRGLLQKAVGPGAETFAATLSETQSREAALAAMEASSFLKSEDEYLTNIFDLRYLTGN